MTQQELSQPYYDYDEEEKSNHKGLWIVITILVLAAIAGATLWYLTQNQHNTSEDDSEQVEAVEEQVEVPTVESVTAELIKIVETGDEAQTLGFLDGIKAKAEELLNDGDQEGYFNIISILRTVFYKNKDFLMVKMPTLADKIEAYTTVPEELKTGFAEFVAKKAIEDYGESMDAISDEDPIVNGNINASERNTLSAQGTYIFEASRTNYKESYETVMLPNGGFSSRSKGYTTPDGYSKWKVYIVVKEDGRVVKIYPHESPKFIGKVSMISDHAFIITDYPSNSYIGANSNYFKGDNRNVGSLGKGWDLFYKPVFDLREQRVYRNKQDYENRDIQESEYLIFEHSSQVYSSNDTEYEHYK